MSSGSGQLDYRPMLRHNPFGDPSVIAEGRSRRPHDSRRHDSPSEPAETTTRHDPNCPFCEGNEDETPPEVDALRPDDTRPDAPGWAVRVVPNLYPAFVPGAEAAASVTRPEGPVFDERPARGRHEVAIHSPDHSGRLGTIGHDRLARTVEVWQRRLREHRGEGWDYTVLAVNEGREAGASLAHPHAQLFAGDFVPPDVLSEIRRQQDWKGDHGSSLLGVTVEAERNGPRYVDSEGSLVAWAPYWSRTKYETWIAPRAPDSRGGAFGDSPNGEDLARLLGRTAARIRAAADDPALNVVLRDVPHKGAPDTWWHFRLLPRMQIVAGYELGSGVHIVTISPETAAEDLANAL